MFRWRKSENLDSFVYRAVNVGSYGKSGDLRHLRHLAIFCPFQPPGPAPIGVGDGMLDVMRAGAARWRAEQ